MPSITQDNSVSHLSPEFQKAYHSVVQADRRPIQALEDRKTKITGRVELLNDLLNRVENVKKSLPALGTPFAFREFEVNSDDPKSVMGTADKRDAVPGKHQIEVHQLAQGASAISNGFTDKDTTHIGTGYLRFEGQNGNYKEIFIDDDYATLQGVATAINKENMGVQASIANDQSNPDAPYRLILQAQGVGTAENIIFPEVYLVDGEEEFSFASDRSATDAVVSYAGFEIRNPGNEIKDLIPGVTLNLKGITQAGHPISVSVEQDIPKTTTKVRDLVNNINQVFEFIETQNKIEPTTDTSKTLGGEYSIRMTKDRLRESLFVNHLNDPTRKIQAMSDLGIQMTRGGTLSFDEKKFENALQTNFDEVVNILSGDGTFGVIPTLYKTIQSLTAVGNGVLSNQKDSQTSQMQKLGKEIDAKQKRFEEHSKDLKAKLARAQSALASMQGQSGFLKGMQSGDAGTNGLIGASG